jgi:hypothetical protein
MNANYNARRRPGVVWAVTPPLMLGQPSGKLPRAGAAPPRVLGVRERVQLDPVAATLPVCCRIPLRSGNEVASPGGVGSIPTIVARSLATLTGTSVRGPQSGRLQHTSPQ